MVARSPSLAEMVDNGRGPDNFLSLEIFYETTSSQVLKEKPAYTVENFAAELGGVLGLWLGFSVLTLVEFVELGIDITVLLGAWLGGRLSGDSKTPVNEIRAQKADTGDTDQVVTRADLNDMRRQIETSQDERNKEMFVVLNNMDNVLRKKHPPEYARSKTGYAFQ